ncbi:MAG: M48 family metallopeptidase [Clostridia bacterium]|nr:M48 family metallopeptidase [Clostridia bacterium]
MTFDYNIIRSKRKTITVSVSADNVITVRCPYSMNDSAVDIFINSKSEWLFKVMAENNIKRSDSESILNYEEIYVGGSRVPLIFSERNKIENDAVYVKSVSSIKKTFIKFFSDELINFAKNISVQTKLRATGYNIRSYKSRWGCCDKNGQITFNYLLIMLPLYLQRYVIIHELCHTVHFNHSQKFWNLVAKFEPNYKLCRKNLKAFNYLTKLY